MTLWSAGSPPLWDTEAVRGRYAGHSGLLYRCSPSTFCDLIAGTERWTDRTFLVQGGRRVSFDDFRCAIAAAGDRLRELGIGRATGSCCSVTSTGMAPGQPDRPQRQANRWWSPEETGHAVNLLGPRHVFADSTTLLFHVGGPSSLLTHLLTLAGEKADKKTLIVEFPS